VTTTIKTDFKVLSDTGASGLLFHIDDDDSTRTLFQIKKGLKRMVFILNRSEGKVKIMGPQYKDEVHYDNEIMSMNRARIVWDLLVSEGWSRNR